MDFVTKHTIEVVIGLSVLIGVLLNFNSLFADAIKKTMQPLKGSIDQLSLVVDNLCKEMEKQRTTIHDLELQVKENETNISNLHRRTKVLEGYHKDKGNA